MKKLGLLLAITAAGCLMSGYAQAAADTHADGQVKCSGVNSCKGTSECKGANNQCKGQNSCKGKGWIHMKDAQACTDAKGQVITDSHS